MNTANRNEVVAESTRRSVAEEIAEYARALSEQADALSNRVNAKLHLVMQSDYPRPCGPEQKDTEYPPLFSDLRSSFRSIADSLDNIGHAMNRTELP